MDKSRGLHVRISAPMEATDSDQIPPGLYRAGQDLFLRDREGYFLPTHSIEVLGQVDPVSLAEKEAIYVRDLETGSIATVQGPRTYLVDPTREEIVVVARLLDHLPLGPGAVSETSGAIRELLSQPPKNGGHSKPSRED